MLNRSTRAFGLVCALLVPPIFAAADIHAQTGIVRVARENFRAAPSGPVLAEVVSDTELPLGDRRDRWREATLEGWVWEPSLRDEREDGHDLVVSASAGENLRASPNGPVVARLRTGMRLNRVESRDRWVRVRRIGWVWEPSLVVEAAELAPPPVPPGTAAATARPPSSGTADSRDFTVAGASGSAVLESPGGDPLASVAPGASVEVLAREGNWVRVRVEGWTFAASLSAGDTAGAAVLRDVSAAELAEAPERFRGRLVEWTIQFIALQEAERFRTDFLEGEPFMLTRGPGEETGFVYVAVPPDRVAEVSRLTPLERVRVVARVRSARSSLTGAPVLDLVEVRPQE